MGKHGKEFSDLFIDNAEGPDLGNVELKYSGKAKTEYTIYKKDIEDPKYIVFFNSVTWYFILCSQLRRKLRFSGNKRSISLRQIKTLCYFATENTLEMQQEMKRIVKNPALHCKF